MASPGGAYTRKGKNFQFPGRPRWVRLRSRARQPARPSSGRRRKSWSSSASWEVGAASAAGRSPSSWSAEAPYSRSRAARVSRSGSEIPFSYPERVLLLIPVRPSPGSASAPAFPGPGAAESRTPSSRRPPLCAVCGGARPPRRPGRGARRPRSSLQVYCRGQTPPVVIFP